jgi:hypothetical protein
MYAGIYKAVSNAFNLIMLKSVLRYSCCAQKNANNPRNTGGPIVSHIDNLSILLFTVGNVHMSHEIWSKYR